MNLVGFRELVPTLFVFRGIFDGDVRRSLLVVLPDVDVFSWFGCFEFHAIFDGDALFFCSFVVDDLVVSLGRFVRENCGVFSGFVGVPWIGESLLGVLVGYRRLARFVTLLLFPEAFKRFLESVVFKRFRESTRRPSFGEERRSFDLLSDVERCRVG